MEFINSLLNNLDNSEKGIIITIIVLILMLTLYISGKRNLVKSIVKDYIHYIEDLYISGGVEADRRLEEVLRRVRDILPFYLKPLATKKVVQKIFDELKERLDIKKEVAARKKIEGAEHIINQALDLKWNGEKCLVSNTQLRELGEEYKGYIEGYGQYSSEKGTEIGVRAGVKL